MDPITNDEPDTDNEDHLKIFVSRIPTKFTEDSVRQLMERHFGSACVQDVNLIYNHAETTPTIEETGEKPIIDNKDSTTHRGFGFITMRTLDSYHLAIQKGTLRVDLPNKRKRAIYLRPIHREIRMDLLNSDSNQSSTDIIPPSTDHINKNTCFLWSEYKCPYGTACKFEHSGQGGCRIVSNLSSTTEDGIIHDQMATKKGKCFSFKKTGKCKLGDACPFRHVQKVKVLEGTTEEETVKKKRNISSVVDSLGGDNEDVQIPSSQIKKNKKQKRDKEKIPQPLSIRVFGLNYNTTEKDVREYFEPCGTIREITFPIFEDSGRSKGYCGVWFTSPKAVQKACEGMDGKELHGRWLRVQAGKMFLRNWEEMEKSNSK